MAMRGSLMNISRRLCSGGKVLNEEEKAAENIYIKKIEREKLEKLARKGPQAEEKVPPKPEERRNPSSSSSTSGVSTDKDRNYAVVAGMVTIFAALGWYIKGTAKKPEVVQD